MRAAGIILGLVFLPWLANAVPVTEPERDFLKDFASDRKEDVIISEVDLNGDGVKDYLFSLSQSMRDGRQGNIWVIYQSAAGTWNRFDELSKGGVIVFHQKAASIQRSGKTVSIYRYSPTSSDRGMVMSYTVGASGVDEKVIHEDYAPLGAQAADFTRLFETKASQLPMRTENAGVLRDRYFPLQKWLEQMNLIRWSLLAIGILLVIFVLAGLGKIAGGMFRLARRG